MVTRVKDFIDGKRERPGGRLDRFMGNFGVVEGKVTWNGSPVVVDADEKEGILRRLWNDESKPKGISKIIKHVNEKYIGFKAEEIRAFIRKQKSY